MAHSRPCCSRRWRGRARSRCAPAEPASCCETPSAPPRWRRASGRRAGRGRVGQRAGEGRTELLSGSAPTARTPRRVPELDAARANSPRRSVRGSSGCSRARRRWARRWDDADVVIEGDPELQLAVRFALFHLMASVAETGEAAVGARGLSGPRLPRPRVLGQRRLRAAVPRGHASAQRPGRCSSTASAGSPAARAAARASAARAPASPGSRRRPASTSRRPHALDRHGRADRRSAPASSRSTSSPTSPGRPPATSTGPATRRSLPRPGARAASSRRPATGRRGSASTRTGEATSTA